MWGCLFADIVAVPVPPPNPERLSSSLPSFNRILEDSGAVAILTDYKFDILVRPVLLPPCPANFHYTSKLPLTWQILAYSGAQLCHAAFAWERAFRTFLQSFATHGC